MMSVAAARAGLRWPTAQDLLFSLKAVLAVTIALAIGFSQDLDNPYWSALTIYVLVAQPQAGAIRSKGLFRLGGTLLGGWIAIAFTAALGSHIGVLLIVLLLTVTATLYLKLLDRTPANYVWFATSLTVAIIGVVHVQSPQTVWYYGVTRMGEIALGILCIGVVDGIILPRSMTPPFVDAMRGWRDDASRWAAAALAPEASNEPAARWERRKALRVIAAAAAPLDAQGVQLPFDIVARAPSRRAVRLLRLLVSRLLAELSSSNIWIEADRELDMPAQVAGAAMAQVRAWIDERPALAPAAIADHAERGERLARDLAETGDTLAAGAGREPVMQAATLTHLASLVSDWVALERTLCAIATGTRLPAPLRRAASRARPARSVDFVAGMLDILPMALAMGLITAIWYATAWTSAINALLFVYVTSAFIIGTPGVVGSALGELVWVSIAYALTFLYQFAVLPRVTAFPVLMGVLACALVPLGIVVAMAPAGLLITANIFGFLGLQNAYAADFETTLQNLAGALVGCVIAVGALYLCGYDEPRFRARRLARAMSRDIAEAGLARRTPDRDRYVSLSVDRMSLFLTAAAALPEGDPLRRIDLVARFRTGGNLLALRACEPHLVAAAAGTVREARRAIAGAYRREDAPDPAPLRATVESAYARLAESEPCPARRDALAALTGLALAMRPDPAFEALLGKGDA